MNNATPLEIVEAVVVCVWLSLPFVLALLSEFGNRPRKDSRRRCAGVRFVNH